MRVERRGLTIWLMAQANQQWEEPVPEAKPYDLRLDRRSRMRREFHVRFCEGAGVRFPRATRLVALCNGTEQQAAELREELYTFLTDELHLQLSMEKTKITHLNDGFRFLGFRIQR